MEKQIQDRFTSYRRKTKIPSQMLNFMTKNSCEAAVELIDFNKGRIEFEVTAPEHVPGFILVKCKRKRTVVAANSTQTDDTTIDKEEGGQKRFRDEIDQSANDG